MQLSIESKMEIFARVYARSMDISIKMGPRFATDGKNIFVPPILDQTDPWIRFETEVCTYHETGHIKTKDFPAFIAIKDKAKRSIFNSVRDVCVEKTMQEEYKGLIKKWNEFNSKYVQTHTNENLLNPSISAFTKLLWIVYLRAREKQNGVNYGLIVPRGLEEIYQKRLAKFEDDLAFNNNTIKDSSTITDNIFEALKEEAKEQEPEPEALKDIQEDIEKEEKAESINEEIQKDINQYAQTTKLYSEIPDLKETVLNIPQRCGWQDEVNTYEAEGKKLTGFCSSKMKILFVSEKAPVMHRHLTHGRLDSRNLWKMDHSNELFKKRSPAIYQDSAVYIVCDHSSSMRDKDKYKMSQALLTSLGSDLDKMNIPFAACGFTYGDFSNPLNDEGIRTDPAIINKIKDFEEPFRTVKHRFVWPLNAQYTAELPAIKFAAERLAVRKESKKILFVLSDGGTCTGNKNLDEAMREATKEYIARLKQAGFKVVLIGILDAHISFYDPEAIIVYNLSTLATTFYSKLMKLIL